MSGHLLATVNPEAAAAADSGWKPAGPPLTDEAETEMRVAPQAEERKLGGATPHALPTIGNIVVYHLREGDSRNRRVKFPAIVMDSDPQLGTLKLWVIVDDGDTWMQDHVPARVPPEPGWELVQSAIPRLLAAEGFEASEADLRSPGFITYTRPSDEMIENILERLAALEAKRGPGRPAKPKE